MKIKIVYASLLGILLLSMVSCASRFQPRADRPELTEKFTRLKLEASYAQDDPVFLAIKKDLRDKASILELMQFYMKELGNNTPVDSPYLKKLSWLFSHGQSIDLRGHYYGLTLVLKKGEHPYGGFLNRLWGATLSEASPWDGKIFEPAFDAELIKYTRGWEKGDIPTFLGINCFKEAWDSVWNILSTEVLTFWFGLKEAPISERQKYGYDKKGGLFIARKTESVHSLDSGKEVLQLNYRWPRLQNPPPLRYLIDEVVEIAEGLYLGQLLFATQNTLEDYDPRRPAKDYKYENFGYFLLMDGEWNQEKIFLFAQ